jgi:acyl-CoA synthetase (AMP-forming)/AMP-acid ligase II
LAPPRTGGTHVRAVPDGTAADAPAGTIGRLFPSTEARLVSVETGEDVGTGEPGEIWIRGPQRMKGYFGRQEETDTLIADGWLHTGDIGTVDEHGWWHVMAFVAERSAPCKRVRQVEFIETVPKSASGKILRRELRVREKAAQA